MTDYRRATKEKFTTADLKQNETLQDKVASWHFSDIDKAIDKLGDAANDYDHDGLKTVAHLGGIGGMKTLCEVRGYTIQKISLVHL